MLKRCCPIFPSVSFVAALMLFAGIDGKSVEAALLSRRRPLRKLTLTNKSGRSSATGVFTVTGPTRKAAKGDFGSTRKRAPWELPTQASIRSFRASRSRAN